MPEIKNTFLGGKMNKSLDDRLLPEGEYRDALNIQVTKSEGADVGVIQNIKGNTRVADNIDLHSSAKVIGTCFDDQNNIVYYFVHHGITKTVESKAQSTSVIFLNNVNAVNAGDFVYSINTVTGEFNTIQGAADKLVVSSVNAQNNSITVVHDPAGVYSNLLPSVTILENTILTFGTNNFVTSKIVEYNKNTNVAREILANSKLNFDKDSLIQANVIENYLFFTDGVNQPRRIDTTKDYTNFKEHNISVVRPAPQFAPEITVLDTDLENAGNYIEEKFVRFAYRYKFSDNTYSVYSPFSNTVFKLDSDILTEAQVQQAYSRGELDFFINSAKTIQIQHKAPDGGTTGWADYDIEQIDILLKSSDSPAVLLLESIKYNPDIEPDDSKLNSAFVYNSEKPKSTISETQLTRVYDNVPIKAIAQEVVGNRIVYGNFTQGFNIDTTQKFPFTLTTSLKNTTTNSYIDYLGVKSNRTYEIGLIFSDDYGRTSPVVFGQNKTVYLNKLVQSNYDKQLAIKFENSLSDAIDAGFKYYSVVVKQSEQEYYNIYTPGFGSVKGKSYFSLFGDNINKLPIDTSTFNSETSINTTRVKTYLSVENKASTDNTLASGQTIDLEAFEYYFEDNGSFLKFITGITNVVGITTSVQNGGESVFINKNEANEFEISEGVGRLELVDPQDETAYFINVPVDTTLHKSVRLTQSGFELAEDIGLNFSNLSGADVYVDGVKKINSIDYIYNKTGTGTQPTIKFTPGNIPETTQDIVVFLKYSNVDIAQGYSNSILSLTTVGGSITVEKIDESHKIAVPVSSIPQEFSIPTTPLVTGNLVELKVTGISTRDNFGLTQELNQDIFDNSVDLSGIYKIKNNYFLAEIDGLYGVPFYQAGDPDPLVKYADLAILETKGFESAIDIYYETATQGTLESLSSATPQDPILIPVDYYNCVNLKAPARGSDSNIVWQESRIKGGFNEASIDYGVQAHISDEDYGLITRQSSLIYSGILNNNTRVNNTNQFPSGENIIRTLDPSHGSIQKLYSDTNDLLIFQEEKVSQALIDKDIIYTAEGQGLTTAGAQVISQINSYATNYGIGKDPLSFAVYAGRKYFVDRPKGAVLRLSADGITEISNYGMHSYFRDLLSDSDIKYIIGCWDMYNKEYVLSVNSYDNAQQVDKSVTLGFDESNNGWVSRYSYMPEAGGSLDGSFYTFKLGDIFEHYTNEEHNKFYFYDAEPTTVDIILNQNPSASKNFLTINYEGSETWNISNIQTDTDSAENIVEYSYLNDDLIISGFKKQDNKYFANIINSSNSVNPNEVVLGKDMSGIKGFFAKLQIKTNSSTYKELFSVSTNYNINSY